MNPEDAHTSGLVVLPNLHELPPDSVAAVCRRPMVNRFVEAACAVAAVVTPRIRRALRTRASLLQRHAEGALHVLADLGAGEPRLFVLSRDDLTLLEQCRLQPGRVAELRSTHPAVFDRFVRHGLLVSEDAALRSVRPTHIEIEINRHCNWRCVFCPVSEKPKPPEFMSEELFRVLLQRVVEYGAESIALHFYGEPLLHPKAVDWIELAVRSGLRVDLYTNGSLLDEHKVRRLAAIGNTSLNVNLPTVDPEEFRRVTGTKQLERCVANLTLAHELQIPVSLVVNAPRESGQEAVDRVNEAFAGMFGESVAWRTNDRAGNLDAPAYATPTALSGRLSGCSVLLHQAVVSYAGKVLPCCQDYDQQWEWGDLTEDSLEDILVSAKALEFKRWVMGLEEPPEGFLCSRCDLTSTLGASGRVLAVGHHVEPQVLADADSRLFFGERVQQV